MSANTTFTVILARAAAGDRAAADELLPMVYEQLCQSAKGIMARERRGHTITATALVHEAYLRLFGPDAAPTFENRAHFFAAAAQAMRRYLVDHARARMAQKRGGPGEDHNGPHIGRTNLADIQEVADLAASADPADILALDDALTRLEQEHPRAAAVVQRRFFAGRSTEDTAVDLELSEATVKREMKFARAWLHSEMRSE